MDKSPFWGTARYYSEYRLGYPRAMIDLMKQTFGLDGTGRLFDVGCGTGKLSIALSPYFESVVALDRDRSMLDELLMQCELNGVQNISAVCGSAEEHSSKTLGCFDLITCGDSFHWMQRDRVLQLWHQMILPKGGLAIVGTGGGSMSSDVPWQKAVWRVIRRWLGEERRHAEWQKDSRRFEDILHQNGFGVFASGHVPATYSRDVNSVIGYLYSTSFCNRSLLGENAVAFERDLRQSLLEIRPDGVFTEEVHAGYIFARPLGPE